jgi:Na+/H+-translocating membrane pyrophosphatase
MQQIHVRSATKCLELVRTNGGIYTKAAQFVASLQGGAGDKGIPKATRNPKPETLNPKP